MATIAETLNDIQKISLAGADRHNEHTGQPSARAGQARSWARGVKVMRNR